MIRILFVLSFLLVSPAFAAGDAPHIPDQDWPQDGITGHYDRGALQRGYKVYREVCAACHSMRLIAYRNLAEIGFSEAEVKAIAADYTVQDGPDDNGEMFDRKAIPADRFVPPYPNKKAARAANNGAYPADLSLIVKARPGGADYIYALLTGYETPPAGTDLPLGMFWNKYFAGHQIAMPNPLFEGMVAYDDGTESSVEQMASDVTQFLHWAAEPELEQRKRMGIKVILFLIAFAFVMYHAKKRVWSQLKD